MAEIVGQWALLEYCFQTILHVDLESVWRVKSFRWFKTMLRGLLTTDTPLSRHFAPTDGEQPEVTDD